MIITLPWPHPKLSPNDRSHWAVKSKHKKAARQYAWAVAGVKPTITGNIPLRVVFHPPTRANRDIDNCLASCKAALDGIAERWGINDKLFQPITVSFGEVYPKGKVVISIDESTQGQTLHTV